MIKNNQGLTPLDYAVLRGFHSVEQFFLKKGGVVLVDTAHLLHLMVSTGRRSTLLLFLLLLYYFYFIIVADIIIDNLFNFTIANVILCNNIFWKSDFFFSIIIIGPELSKVCDRSNEIERT